MNRVQQALVAKTASRVHTQRLDFRKLRALVQQGEGQRLEFKLKATHPEKIVREIVAFANTNGGTLLVGVGDDKTIQGLKFADDEEYTLVRAIEKFCIPVIEYEIERISVAFEREVLVFRIFSDAKKPYSVVMPETDAQKVYVRVADKSVQASKEVRQILKGKTIGKEIRFIYGEKEQKLMRFLEENTEITLEKFMEIAKLPRWLASRTLVVLVLSGVLQILPDDHADTYIRVDNGD